MSEPVKSPMYEYLLTGRNARERRVTEIVEAATADEAVRRFEEQGHTDIVLHTDDLLVPFSKYSEIQSPYTLRDHVRLRTASLLVGMWVGLLRGVPWLYRKGWWIFLLAGGWLLLVLLGYWPVDLLAVLALAVLLAPTALVLGGAVIVYCRSGRSISRAIAWCRWEKVLRLLERPRWNTPCFDYHLLKSEALAGLGRLSDALAEYDRIADMPHIPRYVYWYYQALVYLVAKDREKALIVLARALELAPTASTILVSYAHNLLVLRHDVEQAREFLARARTHAVADIALPHLLAAEGSVFLEEGRPEKAAECLNEALKRLVPFARATPLLLPHQSRIEARLSLAHAALGDTLVARKYIRLAKPLLIANQEHDLLEQCEDAVGS